ncbi:hypothetical protein [Burkholderia gladioli]|uniref:hypothetical protein n=1 Tax=Burkholderia gladioli TaxID=28095 RepID=UPI0038B2476D
MDSGVPPRAADALRALRPGRDWVRAPHVVHALLDAGQLSPLQLALANVLHLRDDGCPGAWTAFHDGAHR